jgi:hypothetical protein
MSLEKAFRQARNRRYGSGAGQPATVASTDPTAPKADDEGSITCPYCGESFTPGDQDEESYRTDDETTDERQANAKRVTEVVKQSLREKGFRI